MKKFNKSYLLYLLSLCLLFTACDGEEENISFQPGDNLLISGTDEFLTYEEESFFVRGFTIDETYTWGIEGDGVATVTPVEGRDGEFVSVMAEDVGTYTLTVSNDNGLAGEFTMTIEDVNEFVGVGIDTLEIYEEQYLAGSDTLFLPINISERNVDSTAVEFTIVDGAAVEGVNFEVLNTDGYIGFSPGQTQAFLPILSMDNITADGARDFRVVLGDVLTTGAKSSAVVSAPDSLEIGQSVVYIWDDVKTADLVVESDTVEVNASGNYLVDVALNAELTENVTLTYSVTDEDGLPVALGVDQTGGVIEIFAGESGDAIVLNIADGLVAEGAGVTYYNVTLETITSADEEVEIGTETVTLMVAPEEEE